MAEQQDVQQDVRNENWNISGRGALRLGLIVLAVLLAVIWGTYGSWLALFPRGAHPVPPPQAVPPLPRLQVDAPADRRAIQRQQRTQLESYGWVDRRAGIAHIPIERAMHLRAEGKQ
jgi:hypothetical protein